MLDSIFPRECFGCGRILKRESCHWHLCGECVGQLELISSGFCPRCGMPYEEECAANGTCHNCMHKTFQFRRARSLFLHLGLGREIVHELKFRQGFFLLPDIGKFAKQLRLPLQNSILVPVPLHWRRRWQRGFNQSELIANAISRACGGRTLNLLRRSRYTRPQIGLSRENRRENVIDAFVINEKMVRREALTGRELLVLVDDVFTTGATMNACASVLKSRGFTQIEALTLAHG